MCVCVEVKGLTTASVCETVLAVPSMGADPGNKHSFSLSLATLWRGDPACRADNDNPLWCDGTQGGPHPMQ